VSDAAQKLAQLAQPGQQLEFAIYTVDSVRDDGTVNLAEGETIHEAVPCQNSYLDRQAGDTVIVARWRAGWQVIGKAGSEWSPPRTLLPTVPRISWGESAPTGTGWVTGTPWVRANELYIQTAAGGGSSPAATPDDVTLAPTSQGAWRDGARDSGQAPTQGAWSYYPHPYTGAWFYGSSISAACAGKSVASMKLRLARTSTRHGSYSAVRPQLYLLSASSAGGSPPSLGDGPLPGPALGLGSSGTFTVPASWRSALASGSAGGIGVFAGVGSQYLIFTGSCGQLTITFN
jgi:hypothetical protein